MLSMRNAVLALACLVFAVAIPAGSEANPHHFARSKKARKVNLNFEASELIDVVKTISKLTGKNFIVEDSARRQRLTIVSGSPVTREEAYEAFLEALRIEGLQIDKAGKFYRISHQSSSRRRSTVGGKCPGIEGIKQIDESTWSIPEDFYAGLNRNSNCIVRTARIVPYMKDGQCRGFKMFGIRKGSMWSHLGIKNGDVIHEVNGNPLTSPERALNIYHKLKDAKDVRLKISRRGEPKIFTYKLP